MPSFKNLNPKSQIFKNCQENNKKKEKKNSTVDFGFEMTLKIGTVTRQNELTIKYFDYNAYFSSA